VEGAKTLHGAGSGFFQRDVVADNPNDIRLLLYELGKV
jgi:hypothetical protein